MCLLILAESAPGCGLGVRAQTEMKIWCVKDMHLLKVVASEKIRKYGNVNTQMSPFVTHGLKRASLHSRNPVTANISQSLKTLIIKVYDDQEIVLVSANLCKYTSANQMTTVIHFILSLT